MRRVSLFKRVRKGPVAESLSGPTSPGSISEVTLNSQTPVGLGVVVDRSVIDAEGVSYFIDVSSWRQHKNSGDFDVIPLGRLGSLELTQELAVRIIKINRYEAK